MTNFENIKAMNIDETTVWLDKYGKFDNSPWKQWFNEKYCSNCPVEHGYLPDYTGMETWHVPTEFSYCELHDKCRFFPDMDETPYNKDIIKMWLEEVVK